MYTGNEGPIDSFYYNTGFMFEIAPKFGALILFIEHRQVEVEEISHFLTFDNNSSISSHKIQPIYVFLIQLINPAIP